MFALRAEQAEHLDRAVAGAAEPVRHPGVELGRLARPQDEIPVAEHHPEPAVQDVEPRCLPVRRAAGRLAG